MLAKTGIPTMENIKEVQPPSGQKGPIAVIECFQEIPCNPCSEACPRGAIAPFEDINHRPRLIPEQCDGCGTCMYRCPGLAIFVVDESFSQEETLVKIPYEYWPLPEKDTKVSLLDRKGKEVGQGRVLRIQQAKALDRTNIIWLAVPKELGMVVRGIGIER